MSLVLRPQPRLRAKISSVGAYLPPRLLTNADLEKVVETNDQWIVERTGIRERHIAEPGVATSDLAAEAARDCLRQRGVSAAELSAGWLGAILVATVTPDMFFPATACLVQEKIGARGVWGFDLSAACSGFIYALQVGAKLIESGSHERVMVIGADVMSSILDYSDRSTCILFGDGAGAVLLEAAQEGEIGLVDFVHEIDGSGASSLYMPGGGSLHPASAETLAQKMHFVHQEGGAVFKVAVRKMAELSEAVLQRNGLTAADVDLFIPHQANRRIILATAERLGMPEDRIIINIGEYGNTTGATIPLGIHTALTQGRLKRGMTVLLASFGGGYTVGATLLRWE
ncbi:MAG: ketoacyl-ACP synthase III [Acidobacteriota bacterium]|nr:ketoacyl-ACP synthase III [Acidobacteriota bacterium]